MTKEQAAVWNHLCVILERMGVLTVADGIQLERYVSLYLQWQQVQKVLATFDTPEALVAAWESDKRRPVIRNAHAAALRIDTAMKQIEGNFGMTPAGRARLGKALNGDAKPVKDTRESKYFGGA